MQQQGFEQDRPILSQTTYKPTQYADESWEIVGERHEDNGFEPSQFEVVSHDADIVDPMFADYGGSSITDAPTRWHLPPELALKQDRELQAKQNQEPEIPTTALTDDEIAAIKEEAYGEGYRKAKEELESAREELRNSFDERLNTILSDLQAQITDNLHLIEKQALELALGISKKLVAEAVDINPEYILNIIQEAVGLAGTATVKTIKISPEDYEFIEVMGGTKAVKGFEDSWEFVAEPTIKSGCVIETTAGEIDYRLDEAWKRIQDKVMKIAK